MFLYVLDADSTPPLEQQSSAKTLALLLWVKGKSTMTFKPAFEDKTTNDNRLCFYLNQLCVLRPISLSERLERVREGEWCLYSSGSCIRG